MKHELSMKHYACCTWWYHNRIFYTSLVDVLRKCGNKRDGANRQWHYIVEFIDNSRLFNYFRQDDNHYMKNRYVSTDKIKICCDNTEMHRDDYGMPEEECVFFSCSNMMNNYDSLFFDLHLLTMRPIGVVSKKAIGALRILFSSWWCNKRDAPTQAIASAIDCTSVPIAAKLDIHQRIIQMEIQQFNKH